MYRGCYDRQTPPGYSGVAFGKNADEKRENSPTPVENGAGEPKTSVTEPPHVNSLFSGASADRRHEVTVMPRDFSGTANEIDEQKENADPTIMSEKPVWFSELSSFFTRKYSLEELLILGTALLLATKEEKEETFPILALALLLLSS